MFTKVFLLALATLVVQCKTECCRPVEPQVCADGTQISNEDDCCGMGKCNIFCCGCEGGCRNSTTEYVVEAGKFKPSVTLVKDPREQVSEFYSNCSLESNRPCAVFLTVEKKYSFNATKIPRLAVGKFQMSTELPLCSDYCDQRPIETNSELVPELDVDSAQVNEDVSDSGIEDPLANIDPIDDNFDLDNFKDSLNTWISSKHSELNHKGWEFSTNLGGLYLCVISPGEEVALEMQPTYVKIKAQLEIRKCDSNHECNTIAGDFMAVHLPITNEAGVMNGTAYCKIKKRTDTPTSRPILLTENATTVRPTPKPSVSYEYSRALQLY